MIGAIAGDIIGAPYEQHPLRSTRFPLFQARSRFTDDTVLTAAVADAILAGGDYLGSIRRFARRHPHAGYGGTFRRWMDAGDPRPYGSWGNGSAMRVSPVGFAFDDERTVLDEAARSAAVTHDHPEGIKGAQATALAVFLARSGGDRHTIRTEVASRFGYDLGRTVASIRPGYAFDVSCQGSVPEAIIAFLDADSFEGAVRNAVSLGGDSDTLACIAGGIAEAFHGGIPEHIAATARSLLTADLRDVEAAFTTWRQQRQPATDGPRPHQR
jgi:ADP-ribosylglycohydrolase